MAPVTADVDAFGTRARKLDPRWLAAGGVAAVALLIGVIWAGVGDPDKPSENAATRASSQPAGASTAVRPASTGSAPVAPAAPAMPTAAATPVATARPATPSATSTLAAAVAPAAAPARAPARRAPELEVKAIAAQVKVRGPLSSKAVTSALDDSLPKIERCYADAVERTPRLEGKVTFGFSIDKAGRAGKVRKVNSTIKDAELQRCSSEAIAKTKFPKPKKRAAQVTLPLSYEKR
jgi:hypothetical protein